MSLLDQVRHQLYKGGEGSGFENHPGGKGGKGNPGGSQKLPSASPLDTVEHVIRKEVGRHNVTVQLKNGESREREVIDFDYTHHTGRKLSATELFTVKAVKVPPEVSNVKINLNPKDDIQATWQDSKGRDVYFYSKAHARQAAAEKFARLKDFNDALPKIRQAIQEGLASSDVKQNTVAAVLYLIDKTGFRIGSNADTKAKKQAYGASTLQGRHVKVDGDTVTFDFVGKKGVHIHKRVKDAQLAQIIGSRLGEDKNQKLFDVDQANIRSFLKQFGGFKVKDFRTWNGTATALKEIKKIKTKPETEAEFRKIQSTVAKAVAKHLGNTPSVCLSAYIDPSAWSSLRKPEWGAWIPKSLAGDE
jgi:DNA topoisomerase-1